MPTPFVEHNCVLFECRSGKLRVGDLANEAALYDVPFDGLCHLPASAIRVAAPTDADAFAVDSAQFYLIDAGAYDAVRSAVLTAEMQTPDYALLGELRNNHQTAFGYLVAGDLYDSEFDGDGVYRLELSLVRPGPPTGPGYDSVAAKEGLRRIISGMNTLVCAGCFEAEIQKHPELGMSPFDKSKKKQWAIAMADYALSQGWTAIGERGSFGEITPLCPACCKTRKR